MAVRGRSAESGIAGGYKLTCLILLLFVWLGIALLVSKPPVQGLGELRSVTDRPAWTIGYLPDGSEDLEKRLALRPDLLFVAGPASLAAAREPAPRTFFPVPDAALPAVDAAARFPHIPEDQLTGYGRTAYFVDFGEARFWFLDAARLAAEPMAQLDWLKRTAADNPQLHRIVLIQQEPVQPEVWQGLAESGADLILIGPRLYAPASAVTEQPAAGYRSSAHPRWAEWTVSGSAGGKAPQLLTVEGRGSRLTAAVEGGAGREAGRLVLDAAGLRHTAAVQERAPVSIGAMWRYHAGGAAVQAVIPPELDPSGERPIQGRFQLPRDDWRSPAYDDAGWMWAPAPFGRSQNSASGRGIRTPLPALPESPAYYFRKSFVMDDEPSDYTEWVLHVAFEDGFIAYLNGTEIARDSIREGLVDYRSLASPHENAGFETFSLTGHRDLLVKGVNTLAVEVHTSHPDSPELWFDASLSGKKTAAGDVPQLGLMARLSFSRNHVIIDNGNDFVWQKVKIQLNGSYHYETELLPRGASSLPLNEFRDASGSAFDPEQMTPHRLTVQVQQGFNGKPGVLEW